MLFASNEKPFSLTQGAVPVKTLSFEAKAPGASSVIETPPRGGKSAREPHDYPRIDVEGPTARSVWWGTVKGETPSVRHSWHQAHNQRENKYPCDFIY